MLVRIAERRRPVPGHRVCKLFRHISYAPQQPYLLSTYSRHGYDKNILLLGLLYNTAFSSLNKPQTAG